MELCTDKLCTMTLLTSFICNSACNYNQISAQKYLNELEGYNFHNYLLPSTLSKNANERKQGIAMKAMNAQVRCSH
jgi:hypothetical protein